MTIAAMKQALEAMIWIEPCDRTKAVEEAITALRQAIAEAEQKPVACVECNGKSEVDTGIGAMVCDVCHGSGVKDSLTTQQPKREPLTDEQIDDIWNRYCDEMGEASINDAHDIARAIEAAHGIKGGA